MTKQEMLDAVDAIRDGGFACARAGDVFRKTALHLFGACDLSAEVVVSMLTDLFHASVEEWDDERTL